MADSAEQAPAAPAASEAPIPIPGLPLPAVTHSPQRAVGTDDVVKLFSFFTSEFRGFLAHVEQAVQVFQTTGALPTHPLYRARAVDLPPAPKPEGGPAAGGGGPGPGRPRKVKRDKIVRKPTAFNYFVKEKIGQYKTDGITIPDDRNNNELFKRAVSEWSALNPDQKKAYGEAYRAAHPELAAGGEGEGGGDDAAAMEAQAQLLLDGAAEAHQAAGTKRKAGEPGGRLAGTAQLAHLPPPGAGAGSLEEHISLTELVNGGEDAVTMAAAGVAPPAAAAPAEAEEPGRKKRKGTSVKSKP